MPKQITTNYYKYCLPHMCSVSCVAILCWLYSEVLKLIDVGIFFRLSDFSPLQLLTRFGVNRDKHLSIYTTQKQNWKATMLINH